MNLTITKAKRQVQKYAEAIGANPEYVTVWDGERMRDWTGDPHYLDSRFLGAVLWDNIDFDAIAWAWKLQRAVDPDYAVGIFEPYNGFIVTLWKES